jgi:RHS repeat-associated protein
MQMPGRKLSGGYRYGFNGKENDNEVKGEGNQQDYGMRMYDGRIGKFLSVDPLTKTFPWYTPYQFSGNSPIAKTDLDGGEPLDFKSKWKYQPLFDLKTGVKVKGTGTEIFVTDTKLGEGLRDVSLVYDEVTKQNWFVHQSGNKNYYLKNADGKNSVMTIDPKTYQVKGGEFVEFESQDQIESKAGAELANGIGKATYGIFSIGAALPAMTAIGGPLLATNSIFSSKFAIGAGADLSVQLARGEKTNFLSVGASGLFGNPFTASFTGSLFKDNKLEFNSGKDILLNTALGGLFGAGADKLGKGIHFSNPTPISNSVTEGIGKYLLNSGAGTATNATRDLITKPPNKSENENK